METIKIPFTGINRSIDDGASTDGQTMELINARIKNGMVEPIAKPLYIGAIPVEVDKMYYHSNAKKYVGVNTSSGQLYAINEDLSSYTTITQASDIQDVAFLGNVLCISDDNGLEYALWNGTTYDFLGTAPELPEINISGTYKVEDVIPDIEFLGGRKSSDLTSEEFKRTPEYNSVSYFDNVIDTLNNEGYIVGSALVRYAFRVSGGGYINVSAPLLVEISDKYTYNVKFSSTNIQSTELRTVYPFQIVNELPNDATFKDRKFSFVVLGMGLSMRTSQSWDLEKWSSFITSVDVFISPLRWLQKEEKKYNELNYEEYEFTSSEEKTLQDAYIFYKIAEYDLKGNISWILDNFSIDSLSLQEKLEEIPSYHKDSASILYTYNSRLHIANISQTLFKGYGYEAYVNRAGVNDTINKNRQVYVYLNTEKGISVVKKNISGLNNYISSLITYPDSRAYKLVIQWDADSEILYKESRTFDLKKHPYLNLSYYFNPISRKPSVSRPTDEYYIRAYRIDLSSGSSMGEFCTEQNTTIEMGNLLKVSSLNNPISFPSAQTYQPSQGEIIGMMSNTAALSQGQFGQYPLYVFSSDGIYAMQVDTSGQTVYSAQTPASRDVCINPNSITGIDNAVVFASKRGLMAINGANITLLSADMDGYLPSCIDSSPIIPKIAKVASFENALSTATFNDYIENAFVSYNYQENELIVTNPDYAYAYVYNMNSASWAKISPNPRFFVNRYPECYGVIDGVLYDMQNNNRTITTLLVLTKPIKMGTLTHKRILQSALRGVVKRALSDLYLRGEPVMFRGESLDIFSDVGLYILGSNDAEHFTLVSGKESIVDIRDLVTKMNKSKAYKYFMVALAGGVRTDVSLNYMEFIASESFTNRLR